MKKYGDKFAGTRFFMIKETRTLMDSRHKELEPILTDEQKDRLKREMERMKEWREGGPRPMPPFRRPFD